jgi:hypothetical protein
MAEGGQVIDFIDEHDRSGQLEDPVEGLGTTTRSSGQ